MQGLASAPAHLPAHPGRHPGPWFGWGGRSPGVLSAAQHLGALLPPTRSPVFDTAGRRLLTRGLPVPLDRSPRPGRTRCWHSTNVWGRV